MLYTTHMVAIKYPPEFPFPTAPASDWSYLAGLTDGEGCIALDRLTKPSGVYYRPSLTIAMCDAGAIDWLWSWFPFGTRFLQTRSGNASPCHRVAFVYHPALYLIRGMYPFLRVKNIQADVLLQMPIALSRRDTTPEIRTIRALAAAEIRRLNLHGAERA